MKTRKVLGRGSWKRPDWYDDVERNRVAWYGTHRALARNRTIEQLREWGEDEAIALHRDAPSIIYVNGSLTIRGLAIRNQWPGCAECRQYTGSMSFVGWYWPGWLCRACQHRLDPGYGHELNTRVASVFARRAIRRGAQSRRGTS